MDRIVGADVVRWLVDGDTDHRCLLHEAKTIRTQCVSELRLIDKMENTWLKRYVHAVAYHFCLPLTAFIM